jgi:predicted CopG family antitoxin
MNQENKKKSEILNNLDELQNQKIKVYANEIKFVVSFFDKRKCKNIEIFFNYFTESELQNLKNIAKNSSELEKNIQNNINSKITNRNKFNDFFSVGQAVLSNLFSNKKEKNSLISSGIIPEKKDGFFDIFENIATSFNEISQLNEQLNKISDLKNRILQKLKIFQAEINNFQLSRDCTSSSFQTMLNTAKELHQIFEVELQNLINEIY